MVNAIIMPKLNQSEDDCIIVKWRVKPGDKVKKNEILFEIETEKAVLEVESFYDGTLLKIVVPEGVATPVNATVAWVGDPGEKVPDVAPAPAAAVPAPIPTAPATPPPPSAPKAQAAAPAAVAVAPVVAAPAPAVSSAPTRRQAISPRARNLARNSAVNTDSIRGTGPGGRVVEKDVRAYLDSKGYGQLRITPAAKALALKEKVDILTVRGTGDTGRIMTGDIERALRERPRTLSKMRQIIAQRLTQSVVTAPHFFVTVPVDMTDLLKFRHELKTRGAPYSVTDFVLESVALALVEFPAMNSSTDGKTARWHSAVHLGMATSLEDGLVVPVIRNAQDLSLAELHAAVVVLAAKARDGKLLPDEMTGSTFTVSNMGMLNIENFTAIINPGESGILAVSSTVHTPVVREGRIVVREVMKITLSSDHRLIDGAVAARFVNAIKSKLEDINLWKSLT
jgi:pyruvate dehydrogenase E2 component (dihydrolipoamide acetyltransferase)